MAAPTSTNNVTSRKLASTITSLWNKIKDTFQTKLPTTGTASGTYAINISGNSATSTNATNHIANTSNPHSVTKSQVGLGNVTNDSQVKRSEMGTANGVATLDANGIINTSQLPSYVDDVLEYTAKSSFPTTGETGKIYVDTSTNLTWRWSGTQYVEISPSLALGETSGTAYRGDRGKTAYDHTSLTNNPHSVTKSQVGLGNVVNTGDSATPVSGGTTKFTTGGAYTELAKKADKGSTVTDVAWDTTNKKITKTIDGATSEVVTPGVMLDSFEDSYENLAGTGIFIAANPQTAWKKYPISKLWSWIQQSIGSILGLYIDNTTQQKRFSGTSSYAVTATNANNANLSHSYNPNTDSGESVLQIGTGTAQSCVRSANTYKVYGWGTASAGYAHTYWELGSDTSRPTLTISYSGTGNAYLMRLTESSLKFSLGSDTATVYLEAYDGLVYQYSGSNAETNYSGSNWTIANPGSQFSVKADRDTEKIEISKSGVATTITGPAINTPRMELYGSTRSLALENSSDNERIRVCQASNTANLYDLQARKFYGPLQGNVTGNADTATKATQDGNGNNIVNTYATKSSCLSVEGIAALPDTSSITPTSSWKKFDGWGTKTGFSQFHSFVTYTVRNAGGSTESIAVGFFTGSNTSGTQIALYNVTLAAGQAFTAVVPFMNRTTTSYGCWIKTTSGSGQTTEISQAYMNFSA